MDIKKETIKTRESVFTKESNILTEADFIVPDSKADIGRILQISGNPKIQSCEVQGEKVIIGGIMEYTVLYLPEKSDENCVASLNHTQSFTDVCEAKGLKNDVFMRAEADVASLDFSLINSRKMSIKATVAATVTAYRQNEIALPTGVECDFPIEIKTKQADTYTVMADEDVLLTLPDRFELPYDMPLVGEILKADAEAVGHDVKIITGKAIIKGAVKLSILYQSPDSSLPAEFFEHEYPFTEIIDLPEIADDMDVDIKYTVSSVYCEADPDSSQIGAEVVVSAHVLATSPLTVNVLDDCYSTEVMLTPQTKTCPLECIVKKCAENVGVRSLVTLPGDCPPIMRIYRVMAKPFIDSISSEGAGIIINGTLDAYILYLSSASDMPLYSFKAEIPFTTSVDAGIITDTADIECDVLSDSCSFALSGENAVDIQAGVTVCLKVTDTKTIKVIESIEVSEEKSAPSAAITVYFVQPGDTMWDVAKRYSVSAEKIYSANQMPSDMPLKAGTALLIP